MQDIRGKYGSEGDYVMDRPMRGPLNPTLVDESTDTYDTIEWLIRNVPESNRVGILGISYDGFLALAALIHPHPALKVAVPMNPMVDGWHGDDWFHYGAFRQINLPYIYEQTGTRSNDELWQDGSFMMTTTSICAPDQPANLGVCTAWIRSAFGASSWPTQPTMISGRRRPWTDWWHATC